MSGQNPFEQRISVLYRLWLAAARCGEPGYTDTHTHRHTPHHTARRGPHGTASPTAPHHGPGHYTSPVRGSGPSTTSRARYGAPYEVYHLCWGRHGHEHFSRTRGTIPRHPPPPMSEAPRAVAAMCRSHGHCHHRHYYHHRHHRPLSCAPLPVGVTAGRPRSTTTRWAAYPTTNVSKPRVW